MSQHHEHEHQHTSGHSESPPDDSHHDHGNHGDHDHDGHAGHGDHAEQFRKLFWFSLILTIPIVLTNHMIQGWLNYSLPDFPGDTWIGPVLGTILFFYGGRVFFEGGVDELKQRQPGMMTLISLAIVVAFLASWATTLGWLDLDFWWELALLITIMLLGHWLEMKALGASSNALAALAELVPDDAERVLADGTSEHISISELMHGDVLLVRPGARVPADGTITEGRAEFDESMLTGESQPVDHVEGDHIIAGSVVGGSAVHFQVTALGDDTAIAGIQRMVADAQKSKSKTQALADRAAAWLFYIATASAVATFFIWWLVIGDLNEAITRTVTLLVIACPHALGLAIPLVIAITTEVGARNGVLIRDRIQLEKFREVDTVLWDKTGTLTEGNHVVQSVKSVDGNDDALLARAASVERLSEHPLARAIVAKANKQSLQLPESRNFQALVGRGVSADIDGTMYEIGGPRIVRDADAVIPSTLQDWHSSWTDKGAAVLYVLKTNEIQGGLVLADAVRPESVIAIQELADAGVTSVMMTGDAQNIANTVAGEIGIDVVHAEVLPEDKLRIVKEAQQAGKIVAMVGDGVNDAPALALANVGLAIGAGTDVAIESAGIILASSDPRTVSGTRRLSAESYRKMVQNLIWAAGYNILAIPLAAGVLAPWGISMPPAAAAVVMSLSTIIVALNAQTLRRFSFLSGRSREALGR